MAVSVHCGQRSEVAALIHAESSLERLVLPPATGLRWSRLRRKAQLFISTLP